MSRTENVISELFQRNAREVVGRGKVKIESSSTEKIVCNEDRCNLFSLQIFCKSHLGLATDNFVNIYDERRFCNVLKCTFLIFF